MITECQIQTLLKKWSPKCIWSFQEFEQRTREEVSLVNAQTNRWLRRWESNDGMNEEVERP